MYEYFDNTIAECNAEGISLGQEEIDSLITESETIFAETQMYIEEMMYGSRDRAQDTINEDYLFSLYDNVAICDDMDY